jgi:hypothetical protein
MKQKKFLKYVFLQIKQFVCVRFECRTFKSEWWTIEKNKRNTCFPCTSSLASAPQITQW